MVGMLGLAAQRAFLRVARGVRHSRQTWGTRRRRATRPSRQPAAKAGRSSRCAHRSLSPPRVGRRAAFRPAARTPPGARAPAPRRPRGPVPARSAKRDGAGARSEEAEAVDAGSLERLGQLPVDRGFDRCSRRLAPDVGKSIPIEPPMSRRRIALAASSAAIMASRSGGNVPSTSIRVIAGVGKCAVRRHRSATIPLRASSTARPTPLPSGLRAPGNATSRRRRGSRAALWDPLPAAVSMFPLPGMPRG